MPPPRTPDGDPPYSPGVLQDTDNQDFRKFPKNKNYNSINDLLKILVKIFLKI